jgi:hypothetical protein
MLQRLTAWRCRTSPIQPPSLSNANISLQNPGTMRTRFYLAVSRFRTGVIGKETRLLGQNQLAKRLPSCALSSCRLSLLTLRFSHMKGAASRLLKNPRPCDRVEVDHDTAADTLRERYFLTAGMRVGLGIMVAHSSAVAATFQDRLLGVFGDLSDASAN